MSSKSISKTFHDFNIESITGDNIKLSDYKDKVVLLVNTASKCGFTPQYAGLQKLYDRYKEDGLVVLGVPSNDFNQELSKDSDVKDFCEIRYGVNFPLTSIQKIKGMMRTLFISGFLVRHLLLHSQDGIFINF